MEILKKKSNIILLGVMVVFLIAGIVFFILGSIPVKEYKVEFDSLGGSAVSTLVVPKNKKIEEPEKPTREGYVFKGWYFGNDLFDFDTKIKKDILLVAHWDEEVIEVEALSLNTDSVELMIGEGITLEANRDEALTWESSDNSIAKVTDGYVEALKEGKVTITVTASNGEKVTCEVEVINNPDIIAVSKITISGPQLVNVGSSIKLSVNITPANATNKTVTWHSSNKTIATVDSLGNVVGLKEGSVTISATTNNGRKASLLVEVKPSENTDVPETPSTPENPENPDNQVEDNPVEPEVPERIPVTKVTISGAVQLRPGEGARLSITIEPTNATDKKVTWSSNNPLVTVDENGNVLVDEKATDGEVIITATVDGVSAEHTINIKSEIE